MESEEKWTLRVGAIEKAVTELGGMCLFAGVWGLVFTLTGVLPTWQTALGLICIGIVIHIAIAFWSFAMQERKPDGLAAFEAGRQAGVCEQAAFARRQQEELERRHGAS